MPGALAGLASTDVDRKLLQDVPGQRHRLPRPDSLALTVTSPSHVHLSSTIAGQAPRWLFTAVLALSFTAGFLLARAWIDSHAGQRRIDLAASTDSTIRQTAVATTTNADISAAKTNYDHACTFIGIAIWPLIGAALCYLAAAVWWATAG